MDPLAPTPYLRYPKPRLTDLEPGPRLCAADSASVAGVLYLTFCNPVAHSTMRDWSHELSHIVFSRLAASHPDTHGLGAQSVLRLSPGSLPLPCPPSTNPACPPRPRSAAWPRKPVLPSQGACAGSGFSSHGPGNLSSTLSGVLDLWCFFSFKFL